MEGGLEKIFGKAINGDKWSDVVAVILPDIVFFINAFEKILPISALLGALILVGSVILERNK